MRVLANYLHPAALQDTPRLFTALAEWGALMIYLRICRRRETGAVYAVKSLVTFLLLALVQLIAGVLPLFFWVPTMLLAVGVMYAAIYWILKIRLRDCGVLTIHAFILAEFAASLSTQLYVWLIQAGIPGTLPVSVLTMMVVYSLVFGLYYHYEKDQIPSDGDLGSTPKELCSVISTGIIIFVVSNVSFVDTRTPFSSSDSILYVRTLVDLCGLLMLMTQMERRNEFALRQESEAINQLLQRQYEQYRLAIDNAEMLRKEMHDMKHYVIALRQENDPEKRFAVLGEMEQAIAVQESFMNTGNRVLDVILTTKSLQCRKKNITLSVMAEGDRLSNIFVKDICSLFGNLLDNAIEAAQQVEDENKRLINLTVRRRGTFVVVECENCCEGVTVRSQRQHGTAAHLLPETTKTDRSRHGYGMKSIEQVADKYNGAMTWALENDWFKVRVLLSPGE